jgi:uncharacterized protein YkwD
MTLGPSLGAAAAILLVLPLTMAPSVAADNARLNSGVVANIYTVRYQAGCTTDIKINPALRLAAQWHANDVLNNGTLSDGLGSDGSTPQSRAVAAGFNGKAVQTVAINDSLAINNLDVINQWYFVPEAFAIMSDCANTSIGVWSENSLDRSVVVAVYGKDASA